jgi:Transglutaminase-like superfamily
MKANSIILMIGIFAAIITSAILVKMAADNHLAVQARYALTSYSASPEDTQWRPGAAPANFISEQGQLPMALSGVRSLLLNQDYETSFELALTVVRHLASGAGPGKGEIDTDIVSTYGKVMTGGYGDCADYSRLFTGLAYAVDLNARIWTTSFEGFGSDGHVFSEVFWQERARWVFVDSLNAFYVTDAVSGEPLSVLEFTQRLRRNRGDEEVEVRVIDSDQFSFAGQREVLDYYRRGADRFALRMANNVFSYDRLPWVRTLRPHSRSLEQLVSIVVGAYPELLIVENIENREDLESLEALRKKVLTLLVVFFLGILAVTGAGLAMLRSRFAAANTLVIPPT